MAAARNPSTGVRRNNATSNTSAWLIKNIPFFENTSKWQRIGTEEIF
jgi:hypothetical protein